MSVTNVYLGTYGGSPENMWGALDLDVAQAMADAGTQVSPLDQKIITLCGSTRFRKEWEAAKLLLSQIGHCPITVEFYHHDDDVHLSASSKTRLDELHKRKIDIADVVFIVNVQGYVGESTMSEILYATALKKPIGWLEPKYAMAVKVAVAGLAPPDSV